MANRQNIQMLFDEMTIEHVIAFMKNNDWILSESQNPEVTAFEFERDGENKRLWIWSAPTNPKFRSRIQNLVFSLAVQKGVEPIEIANEIVDTKLVEQKEAVNELNSAGVSDSKNKPFEVVLKNDSDAPTDLLLEGDWASPCQIEAGHRVCIIGESLKESPEVSIGVGRITISSSSPDRIRIFSVGSVGSANQSCTYDFIRDTVASAFKAFKVADPESLTKKLGPAIERAAFELGDVVLSPGFERFVLKSVAVFLASVVELFDESDEDQSQLLWVICSQVVSNLHLAVELFPDCEKLLWHSVKSDDPTSPKATFSWLNDRVTVRS